MAGKSGFEHCCQEEKVIKSDYKRALREAQFTHAQIAMIWDFYVTHALSGGTGLERSLVDYGWKNTKDSQNGYTAIERSLIERAELENNICFIRSRTCKDTLKAMNLSGERICISHPRAVLLQYSNVSVDENDEAKIESKENHAVCLFRHIRNAFAHGNTYFFDNGFALLEDKDGSVTSSMILIRQQTLLDWIGVIDRDGRYYILNDGNNEET